MEPFCYVADKGDGRCSLQQFETARSASHVQTVEVYIEILLGPATYLETLGRSQKQLEPLARGDSERHTRFLVIFVQFQNATKNNMIITTLATSAKLFGRPCCR